MDKLDFIIIGIVFVGLLCFLIQLYDKLTKISREFKKLDFIAGGMEQRMNKLNEVIYSIDKNSKVLRRQKLQLKDDITDSQVINIQDIVYKDYARRIENNRKTELFNASCKTIPGQNPEDTIILFDNENN